MREAVFKSMEFWLETGVDGFRLDAIPYLIERDGTSNENLRETHDVIKELRARLDAKYPGRLLLAEANMWPEDVREYFGDGDECHMAYHFPLMPRMYMAIAQEDRHPVVEILAQTPEIPANCQWAVFLRNHDELTLEMVTSKERDYMYKMYATDARARINLGIRRRLAPLLENDRARIELMTSLLLSMPGTPVLYYGDEIGMGDNIFLGDRDGVRTPMQWTSDRNGGFSRVDPQRLYLPPIQDPIYGFEAVNVEAQVREASSLLNWTRRLLTVRRSSQAFGRGRFTMLHPGNRKILAYLRELDDEVVLCVSNVSRNAQPVELELGTYRGRVPVEMMGRNAFPPIGSQPYLLTLPAYGFFWFRLATDVDPPRWHTESQQIEDLPVVVLFDGWNSFFRGRVVPWRIGMAEKTRMQLERALLPPYFVRQRWYAAKAEKLERVDLTEHAQLTDGGEEQWLLTLAEAHAPSGVTRYFAPLAIAFEDDDEERTRQLGAAAVARVRQQARVGVLADAMADEAFCRAVVRAIGSGRTLKAEGGTLQFTPGRLFDTVAGAALFEPMPVRRLMTSSNSVSLLGDKLFLKAYRRLQPGESPELEMGRFLTDAVGFKHAVPVAGSLSLVSAAGEVTTLALLQAQVGNQGDAWAFVVDQVARMLESSDTSEGSGVVERVRVLARRIGELHVALATVTGDPAFDPEPVTSHDLAGWGAAVAREIDDTLGRLRRHAEGAAIDASDAGIARVIDSGPALHERVQRLAKAQPIGLKTRLHGDLHLGQILLQRDNFLIIDFEGEPQRPLQERRAKHSALRDVAGMLRSFDYARHAALNQVAKTPPELERLAQPSRDWGQRVREAFLASYRQVVVSAGLYADDAAFERALELTTLFEIEKALYELRYELDNRPGWVAVPLAGIAELAGLAP